jgi:thioredoxin
MDLKQYKQLLAKKKLPVLVEFWAPWCIPCKGMAPLIEAAGKKHKDTVEVWRINADQNPELLRSLGIRGIPTMIGYNQGAEVFRKTGATNAPGLESLFAAVAEGKEVINGPTPLGRIVRLGIALVIAILGISQGPNYWLLALAGLVLFWAVYDRCPIYKALKPRLKKLFSRDSG